MKKIGITANCSNKRAGEVVRRIAAKARALGLKVFADRGTARLVKDAGVSRGAPGPVDALIAVGGDGTMLRAVRELAGRDIPVMGVNIGGLGFLTSVAEGDVERALECLAKDRFSTSSRTVVKCSVIRGKKVAADYRGLNDVVVATGPSARVFTLDVSVDGGTSTSYICDGMIVSTPTGSTGHSLSAGGPILLPESKVFVMSLICPHTLSSRPVVLPDSSEITIRVKDVEGRGRISVDGQVGMLLSRGDIVKVTRDSRSVRFIHLPGYSYFSVLHQKLRWSGSNR